MLKYDDAGLRDVWLANGYELHDTAYGKAVSYHDVHGLTRALCAALVDKPGPLTGAEFRYLRLLWIEKHNGNEPIVRAMNRLNEVERLVSQKIVARESRTKGWTTKSEALDA